MVPVRKRSQGKCQQPRGRKGAQQQPGESNENKRGAKTVTVNGIPVLSVRDVSVLSKLNKLVSFMTQSKRGFLVLE